MLLGPRPTSLPSGILIHPAILVTTDMSQKLVGAPLGEGDLDPNLSHNVNRAEAYLQAKFRVDPSNRLATIHQRHRQTGQVPHNKSPLILGLLKQCSTPLWST